MPNSDDFDDEDEGFVETDGFTDAEDFIGDDIDAFIDDMEGTALIDDMYGYEDFADFADFDEDIEVEQDGCGEWGLAGGAASLSDSTSLGNSSKPEEGSDRSIC